MPRTKKTVTQEVAQQEQKMPTVLKQPITANTPKLDALIAERIDEEGNSKFYHEDYQRMETPRNLFWAIWNNYGSNLQRWSLTTFTINAYRIKQMFSKEIVDNYTNSHTDHGQITSWELRHYISELGELHNNKAMSLAVIGALKGLIKVIEKHVKELDTAIEIAEEIQAVAIENYSDIIPAERFEFRTNFIDAEYVQDKTKQLEM